MNVVYLVQQPFGPRDRRRYGVDLMLARGNQVTVVDVGPLMLPTLNPDRSHYSGINDIRVEIVSDHAALARMGDVFRSAQVVFCFIASQSFSRRAVPILRLLRLSGAPYVLAMVNAVPGGTPGDRHYSLLDRAREIWARRREIDPLNSTVVRLPLWLSGIASARAIVFSGRLSVGPCRLRSRETHAIYAHSMDYDVYLEERTKAHKADNIAVFLDQNLAYTQSHIAELGARSWLDPDTYFAGLRVLFDRIEEQLGLRVVVALHPRARYEDPSALFGGREAAVGNTAAMVARSRLAITHTSTAVNFAALFRKPVLFAVTRELYEVHPYQRYWYDNFPPALDRRLQYFDRPAGIDLSDALAVNDKAYDSYVANYIKTPGTPDLPYWQIVADELGRSGIARL